MLQSIAPLPHTMQADILMSPFSANSVSQVMLHAGLLARDVRAVGAGLCAMDPRSARPKASFFVSVVVMLAKLYIRQPATGQV